MNEKLWEIITRIADQKEFSQAEMALAKENLDADVFFELKEQMQKGSHMRSDQWI